MVLGEEVVINYFKEKGFEIIKNNPEGNVGVPDFKVFNFKTGERFYVEAKTNYSLLSKNQKIKIVSLIKNKNRVLLSSFITKKYLLSFYELDFNLGRKHLYTVKIKKRNIRSTFYFICKQCNYEWEGRIEDPKECPKCKSRSWNKDD